MTTFGLTLVDVPIPPEIAGTEYARHIVTSLGFKPEDRRVLPALMRHRLESYGPQEKELVIDPLDRISKFLNATFVFDDLSYHEREEFRLRFEQTDPVASAWYEGHHIRMSKLSGVFAGMEDLKETAGPVLSRILAPHRPGRSNVQDVIDTLRQTCRVRWKKMDLDPHIDVAGLRELKLDFLRADLAPMAQDFFDATLLARNNNRPIGTLPNGDISQSMQELFDIYSFVRNIDAANSNFGQPSNREPER